MLAAVSGFINRQRPLIKQLRLGVFPQGKVNAGQVSQVFGNFGMLSAVSGLVNRQRLLIEGPGFVKGASFVIIVAERG